MYIHSHSIIRAAQNAAQKVFQKIRCRSKKFPTSTFSNRINDIYILESITTETQKFFSSEYSKRLFE